MASSNMDLAEVGALVGDPARANILSARMDGRALTPTELADVAGVTPQTTSGHLARLTQANLLALVKRGRNRYYRLASPLVGNMLEGVMAVAAVQLPVRQRTPSRIDDEMRAARTCYDHVAGRLGVGLANALTARGHIILAADGGEVTDAGLAFLAAFGIDLSEAKGRQRAFCRPCLDWSERRCHIAGAVGAALCARALELHWIERRAHTRALTITPKGQRGFADTFGVALSRAEEGTG
jgi:DNA-binding transcriptional ArsR family regulator